MSLLIWIILGIFIIGAAYFAMKKFKPAKKDNSNSENQTGA